MQGKAEIIDATPVLVLPVQRWRDGIAESVQDAIAQETPIALVYNGISHAVMMATPQDLVDFAYGFSFTEGIITHASQIYGVEVLPQAEGIMLDIELASERFAQLKEHRRSLVGRTGCGLCGAESLQQMCEAKSAVTQHANDTLNFTPLPIVAMHTALKQMAAQQKIQQSTGATHACAWASMDGIAQIVREDVGRHNALDKVIGARLQQQKNAPAINISTINAVAPSSPPQGFVVTSSRASYEMVLKAASIQAAALVAVSAPTALAIQLAQQNAMTLVGFCRDKQWVVYAGEVA